jgi:hypothetical protein
VLLKKFNCAGKRGGWGALKIAVDLPRFPRIFGGVGKASPDYLTCSPSTLHLVCPVVLTTIMAYPPLRPIKRLLVANRYSHNNPISKLLLIYQQRRNRNKNPIHG